MILNANQAALVAKAMLNYPHSAIGATHEIVQRRDGKRLFTMLECTNGSWVVVAPDGRVEIYESTEHFVAIYLPNYNYYAV